MIFRTLDTGREVRRLNVHEGKVMGLAMMRGGRRAVSASADGTVKVWDLEDGRIVSSFVGDGQMSACAVSPARSDRRRRRAGTDALLPTRGVARSGPRMTGTRETPECPWK